MRAFTAFMTTALFAAEPTLAFHGRRLQTPPVQTYFVPLPETDLIHTLQTVRDEVDGDIITLISIAVARNNTIIWYDHWEDGYETDVTNPRSNSTLVIGDGDVSNGALPGIFQDAEDVLAAGDSIILENTVPVADDNMDVKFDARDKIQTSFPIAVTRAAYPEVPGSLFAGAVEVQDTNNWGTIFEVPVGPTTESIISTSAFELTEVYIMAEEDDTSVTLADGSVIMLNQGQSNKIYANQGDVITSSRPVQTHLLVADKDTKWELRWYSLLPREVWSSEYYTPVGTVRKGETVAWLYNPNDETITVTSNIGGPYTIPSKATIKTEPVPENHGARFVSESPSLVFFGVVQVDADWAPDGEPGQEYDWGHPLIPSDQLTSQALIGLGYGCTANNCMDDGSKSVIFVMPVENATVCVDFDNDGYTEPRDVSYEMVALQGKRVSDDGIDGDNDMSGALLYAISDGTCDDPGTLIDIAVAWGQDPATILDANDQFISLDLGTVIVPFPEIEASKSVALIDTADDGEINAGDVLSYTILVQNTGRTKIAAGAFLVRDYLPEATSYVRGTTMYDSGSGPVPIDDDTSGSFFPLDDDGLALQTILEPNAPHSISFEVVIDSIDQLKSGTNEIINEGDVYSNGNPGSPDDTFRTVSPLVFHASITIDNLATLGPDGDCDLAVDHIQVPLNADVTYCFTIVNDGDTFLDSFSVTNEVLEERGGTVSGTVPTILAPGGSFVLTLDNNIEADFFLNNSAVVTAVPTYADGRLIADVGTVTDDDDSSVEIVTSEPTASPTDLPSGVPSLAPSGLPSSIPSDSPSLTPSTPPSWLPSAMPSSVPSERPSLLPSKGPSSVPSESPSDEPSEAPSSVPSESPSYEPSESPSSMPSLRPSDEPSEAPSSLPSLIPSYEPSESPSSVPTESPSQAPSEGPSVVLSDVPSSLPSLSPSFFPSTVPSKTPSSRPSTSPSLSPSYEPSGMPSVVASDNPSTMPSVSPSLVPTVAPSSVPSDSPTLEPSGLPSLEPSESPSFAPTEGPSSEPSRSPSSMPSASPSMVPSESPSSVPSWLSNDPSSVPSELPSVVQSEMPSSEPSLLSVLGKTTKAPTTDIPSSAPSASMAPTHDFFCPYPDIDVENTVYTGHDSGASCPGAESVTDFMGTSVTYCFNVTNVGDFPLKNITLSNSELLQRYNAEIKGTIPDTLFPQESCIAYIEEFMVEDLTNTATVVANPIYFDGSLPPPRFKEVKDFDTSSVEVICEDPLPTPVATHNQTCDVEVDVSCHAAIFNPSLKTSSKEECKKCPTAITFKYLGGGCDQRTHDQYGAFWCEDADIGPPPKTGSANITVTDRSGDVIYFSRSVKVGESFEVYMLGGKQYGLFTSVTIEVDGSERQSFIFRTACSEDLFLNDIFGALQIVGFTNQEQGIVSVERIHDGIELIPCNDLQAPESLSCYERPKSMSLKYVGGNCTETTNDQFGRLTCIDEYGGAPKEGTVHIQVTSTPGGSMSRDEITTYFQGDVDVGETFYLDIGRDGVSSRVRVVVQEKESGMTVQDVIFQASCSKPLAVFDQFGGVQVMSYANNAQGYVFGQIDAVYTYTVTNVEYMSKIDLVVEHNGTCSTLTTDGNFLSGETFEVTEARLVELTSWSYESTTTATVTGIFSQTGNLCDASTTTIDVQIPALPEEPEKDGLCEDRPWGMSFTYLGGDCDQTTNTQFGTYSCTTIDPEALSRNIDATIVVTNKDDTITYFFGHVFVGEQFSLETNGERIESNIKLVVMINYAIVQTLMIHTSCSKDLFFGDIFGSVQLHSFVNQRQGNVTIENP